MQIGNKWKLLPYFLLIAYVLFITYNFYRFNSRLNYILEHPVHVLQFARDIKTRLGEMENTLPGLMATPELSYDDILAILKKQEDMQDASFNSIRKIFVGNPQLLDSLANAFTKIRELRRAAAQQLIGNEDFTKSREVYNRLIAPQLEVVSEAVDAIINSAKNLMATKKAQSEEDGIINVVITFLVGILIAMAFLVVNRQDKKKTKLLEDRDRLFNQLAKNVDEIFIVANSSHDFEYVTTNSNRIFNLADRDILASPRKLYDILPPEDATWLSGMLDGTVQDEPGTEHAVIMDNGNRVFRLCVYPIPDARRHRSIVCIQDRTNDFKQKQALGDALENAHAASVAKSSFLSHISHEIRTPMNAIIGMTTIALSRINDQDRVQDCLVKIAESSKHLLRLINDVLDMSKIENGKLSINHEPFSLPANIRNINDLVRPQAEARKLDFEIFQENVDEDELLGDPLRLNQILLNILSNSLKFTPAGGTISLTVKQLSKKHNNVRLAFILKDSGIGMSQEFLDRLYHPFEQASSSTASKYGGTGLGMSITFNLVNLMGGTINVKSREGEGTTFIVELPFGYTDNSRNRADNLPTLRVLIVDDDPGTCEHATLLLEKMGMVVRWCTSGRDAIELVKEAHAAAAAFDVCFIDWKMPDMDGAETARRVREVCGDDLLIIIISAYDWTPIEEKAREAGVNDFVAKPFFASTLYNALLTTTQRYDLEHASSPAREDDNYDFSGKRILLVEDNEFNREIAQEFLAMVNATVENAENGREAVDKFANSGKGYYDLILMDVQMPIMGGYEATRAIRASSHPDAAIVPILAMTANAFSDDVANAVASGMNGHIAKPIDVKELYRMLRGHLEKKEGQN